MWCVCSPRGTFFSGTSPLIKRTSLHYGTLMEQHASKKCKQLFEYQNLLLVTSGG
jgi:hypothetical protein